MQCPVCRQDQLIVEYQGIELDMCADGCGTWFDADELRQLFEAAGAPALLHDLEEHLQEMPPGDGGPTRRCPRCNGRMLHVRAPGASGDVILDRCRRGHGLWFDRGELEDVLSLQVEEDDAALAKVREFLGRFADTGGAPDAAGPTTRE
jgi:Zn-finger nucleic acid-binding protein